MARRRNDPEGGTTSSEGSGTEAAASTEETSTEETTETVTPATPSDSTWAKTVSEPAADGSVTIDLDTYQPPEKKPGDWRDTDRDGLTDAQEAAMGTDPLRDADADGDGVSDGVEATSGMDPFNPDSDGDTIPDGVEFDRSHLAAIVPAADPSKASDADWDGDGFSNETESMYGMNSSVPESSIPGNEARMAQNYELRKTGDPLHDAILAHDLQQPLTPEEEDRVLDSVFDGMTSPDIRVRYRTAVALQETDGTPISPELQGEYDTFVADLQNATVKRDLKSWIDAQNAQGLPVNQQTIDGFVNPTPNQILADGRQAMLNLGVEDLTGTPLGDAMDAVLGITSDAAPSTDVTPLPGQVLSGTAFGTGATGTTGTSPTGSTSGTSPTVNQADALLDRIATTPPGGGTGGETPTSPTSPSSPASGTGGDIDAALANLQAPSTEAPDIPTSRGSDDPVAAPASPTMSSFGTGATSPTAIVSGADDEMTVVPTNIADVQTTTRPDGTVDHTTVTYTDGSKDVLDKDGNMIFHTNPPAPEADAGDTDPNAGTTDDDGDNTPPDDEDPPPDDDPPPEDEDDPEGDGTAYVNPDADVGVGSVPATLSPVVAQAVATGVDPTTTTPSGPYVDDDVAPVNVTSEVVTVGLDVGPRPGVIDGNPDADPGVDLSTGAAPPTSNPATGPDTIDPNDPLVGSGGEDVNPDDFTPRPSNALLGAIGDDGLALSEDSSLESSGLGDASGLGAGIDPDANAVQEGEPDGVDPDPFD